MAACKKLELYPQLLSKMRLNIVQNILLGRSSKTTNGSQRLIAKLLTDKA